MFKINMIIIIIIRTVYLPETKYARITIYESQTFKHQSLNKTKTLTSNVPISSEFLFLFSLWRVNKMKRNTNHRFSMVLPVPAVLADLEIFPVTSNTNHEFHFQIIARSFQAENHELQHNTIAHKPTNIISAQNYLINHVLYYVTMK